MLERAGAHRSFPLITTVYSYRPPEVRRAIDQALRDGFPHGIIMGGTNPAGGLDNFHRPLINEVIEYFANDVPALAGFQHAYPTPGSEEGIREIMTLLQSRGVTQIYVLKGEYEGYRFVGETRNLQTIEVDPETNPSSIDPGYWFVSNPSARDGNIIPNEVITNICEAGHKVFYDFAYLGSTQLHLFDVSHPNIEFVVMSMSKTFGMFYDRVGFALGREPIPSLIGNKWFKNVFSSLLARAVLNEVKPGQLAQKYGAIQREIIQAINEEFDLNMTPSDAFLLGLIDSEAAKQLAPEQLAMIARFKRGDKYRFCLTPEFFRRDPEHIALFAEWHTYVTAQRDILPDGQLVELEALRQEFLG